MEKNFVLMKSNVLSFFQIDFASRSCKEGFYERLERTGQIDRRTLEASPPARPVMHQGYQGSVGRGRDFRDSYGKGYTYHGRYGAVRGNFNEYSQVCNYSALLRYLSPVTSGQFSIFT